MGAGARIKNFSMVMSVDNISRKEGVTHEVYFPPVKGDALDWVNCQPSNGQKFIRRPSKNVIFTVQSAE